MSCAPSDSLHRRIRACTSVVKLCFATPNNDLVAQTHRPCANNYGTPYGNIKVSLQLKKGRANAAALLGHTNSDQEFLNIRTKILFVHN